MDAGNDHHGTIQITIYDSCRNCITLVSLLSRDPFRSPVLSLPQRRFSVQHPNGSRAGVFDESVPPRVHHGLKWFVVTNIDHRAIQKSGELGWLRTDYMGDVQVLLLACLQQVRDPEHIVVRRESNRQARTGWLALCPASQVKLNGAVRFRNLAPELIETTGFSLGLVENEEKDCGQSNNRNNSPSHQFRCCRTLPQRE